MKQDSATNSQVEKNLQQKLRDIHTLNSFGDKTVFGLLFLGLVSLALMFFPPGFMVAAVPLCLAFLIYGRMLGATLISIMFIAIGFAAAKGSLPWELFVVFANAAMYSIIVAELLLRGLSPIRTVLTSGLIVLTLTVVILGVTTYKYGFSLKGQLVETFQIVSTKLHEEISKDAGKFVSGESMQELEQFQTYLSDPKALAQTILSWLPTIIFVSVYFSLWVMNFMLLRNRRLWTTRLKYLYQTRDLLNFRMPEFTVWPLIVALSATLLGYFGKFELAGLAYLIGKNLLGCLSVLYFFQGVGVIFVGLRTLGVVGFFHFLSLMFIFYFAWKVVPFVGLADYWVDFRKLIKKKLDTKGEFL